jgi:hypothetical protein
MQRRKVIIYSIFVVTLVYGAYFHFFSGDGNGNRVSDALFRIDTPGPAMVVASANPLTQPSSGGKEDSNSALKWISDPFRNDHEYRRPSAPISAKENQVLQRPRLSAISASEHGSMAVVDGRVVAVGQKVGDWRLIEVTEEAALLEGPEGPVWVKLGG